MPSTSIVDYQLLIDDSFTLDAEDPSAKTRELSFTMPDDFVFSSGSRKPILNFVITTFEDSSFTIFVNGRDVASGNISQGPARSYHEAFSTTTAFPEGTSFSDNVPVRFSISSGRARFSDVVLWYQVRR